MEKCCNNRKEFGGEKVKHKQRGTPILCKKCSNNVKFIEESLSAKYRHGYFICNTCGYFHSAVKLPVVKRPPKLGFMEIQKF